MAARRDEGPRELDPLKRGLTHNPFAGLSDKLGPVPERAPDAPAPPDAQAQPAAPRPKAITARVDVRRERAGRGGKAVTIVEGPALAGRKLEGYARELSRALGTGARVEAGTLVVQGDQPDRVAAWLAQQGFTNVQRAN